MPLLKFPGSRLPDYNPSCNRIVLSSEATSHLCGAVISPSSSSSVLSTSLCEHLLEGVQDGLECGAGDSS